MRRLLLYFVLLLAGLSFMHYSGAQTTYRNQEFSIANENDVYTFKNHDRYYSNGIIMNFRFIPKPGSFFGTSEADSVKKRIVAIEFAQKYYTPIDLTLVDFNDFDRPYAGFLYGALTLSGFPAEQTRIEYGAEIGVVGSASGAEKFQKWYHRNFGFPDPLGWGFQIPDEVVFNMNVEYNRQFFLVPQKLDLITSSRATLGTAFIHTYQRVDVRIGKLQTLDRSSFKNALIGRGSERFEQHGYWFVGYGIQYVAHNITVQGSLWNADSPHTESILPWVRHLRVGWALNAVGITFKMTYNWLSKEVKGARQHDYIALELLLRFRSGS